MARLGEPAALRPSNWPPKGARWQAGSGPGGYAGPSGLSRRHANGGAAASTARMERANGGHESRERADIPRKRRRAARGRRRGARGERGLPSLRAARQGVSAHRLPPSTLSAVVARVVVFLFVLLWWWWRRRWLLLLLWTRTSTERKAALLRQHAHTAGARRQRAKDPLWARRIRASTHAPCSRASQQRPSVHIT